MRILITNDDGIDSEGIRCLIRAALDRGHECLVSAPVNQCSANSQHITLLSPLLTDRRYRDIDGCEAYAVYGTPSDCVRIFRELFDRKPDICISGINDGENAGAAVYYSGTVSAAREAAMQGLPAIAVSLMPGACGPARKQAAEKAVLCAERIVQGKWELPPLGVVNLNFPAADPAEWGQERVCSLSVSCYHDVYLSRTVPKTGEKYFWLAPGLHADEPEEGSDWYWLRKGCPTCTLLGVLSDKNEDYAGKLQEMLQKTCKNAPNPL